MYLYILAGNPRGLAVTSCNHLYAVYYTTSPLAHSGYNNSFIQLGQKKYHILLKLASHKRLSTPCNSKSGNSRQHGTASLSSEWTRRCSRRAEGTNALNSWQTGQDVRPTETEWLFQRCAASGLHLPNSAPHSGQAKVFPSPATWHERWLSSSDGANLWTHCGPEWKRTPQKM